MSNELRIKVAHQGQFGALMREKLGLPPIPSQTFGVYEQPFTLGSITIYSAGITVGHSIQRACLTVGFWGTGLSGKQINKGLLGHKLMNDRTVQLDSRGSVKARLTLPDWQAFVDQVFVKVNGNSLTTIPLTDQLVKMARDVIAYRRAAPTDAEWAAETAANEQKENNMEDELQFHEYANLFPMMEPEDLAHLVEDMRQNGYRVDDPIVLVDGKILDGRNRYLASQQADVLPMYTEYGGDDPLGYVIARNLHRRHLTSPQRAAVAVVLMPLLEEQARERQGQRTDLDDNIPEIIPESGEAREKAAEMTGTNPRYVQDAKRLQEEAPELLDEVKAGTISLPAATQHSKNRALLMVKAPDLLTLVETKGAISMATAALIVREAPDLVGSVVKHNTTGAEALEIIKNRKAEGKAAAARMAEDAALLDGEPALNVGEDDEAPDWMEDYEDEALVDDGEAGLPYDEQIEHEPDQPQDPTLTPDRTDPPSYLLDVVTAADRADRGYLAALDRIRSTDPYLAAIQQVLLTDAQMLNYAKYVRVRALLVEHWTTLLDRLTVLDDPKDPRREANLAQQVRGFIVDRLDEADGRKPQGAPLVQIDSEAAR